MRPLRCLLISVFCLAATAISCSAVASTGENSWYSIEIIVFARNAADSGQTEEWPQDQTLPDWSGAIPLTPRPNDMAETAQAAATPVVPAPRSAYRLNGITHRLEQTSDRLEPLLHLAWRQPVTSSDKADALYLQAPFAQQESSLAVTPPRVEGTITVSRNRYLHVDLDLLLRKTVSQDYAQTGYPASGDYTPFRHYRMQGHRRMRSGELHYLDHPLMGVMVRIDPYQPPAPPSPSPTTEAPAPAAEGPATAEPATPPAPAEQPAASPPTHNI